MLAQYPATYCDAHGEEVTTILNDGEMLRMTVRGVEFTGCFVDDFKPTVPLDDPTLSSFPLAYDGENSKYLCACTFKYDVPIPVVTPGGIVQTVLQVRVELGSPTERGGLDREIVQLALHLGDNIYSGSGTWGYFENELLEIQRALPEGTYIKACINCAFSDYSIAGNGAFGCMLCFRGNKEEYRKVRGKLDYIPVMYHYTEVVQETYLCPEFERRKPGTGYRG